GPEPEEEADEPEDEDTRFLRERTERSALAEPASARPALVLALALRRVTDDLAEELIDCQASRDFRIDPRDTAAWDYNTESIIRGLEGERVGPPDEDDPGVDQVVEPVRALLAKVADGDDQGDGAADAADSNATADSRNAASSAPELTPRSLGGSGNP